MDFFKFVRLATRLTKQKYGVISVCILISTKMDYDQGHAADATHQIEKLALKLLIYVIITE